MDAEHDAIRVKVKAFVKDLADDQHKERRMDHHDNRPREHHGEEEPLDGQHHHEEHEHHKEKDANDLVNIEVKAKSHDRDFAHEKHATSSDERRDWGPNGENRMSGEGAKMKE